MFSSVWCAFENVLAPRPDPSEEFQVLAVYLFSLLYLSFFEQNTSVLYKLTHYIDLSIHFTLKAFLKSGQLNRAIELLRTNQNLPLNFLDAAGLSPIHYACIHGNLVVHHKFIAILLSPFFSSLLFLL